MNSYAVYYGPVKSELLAVVHIHNVLNERDAADVATTYFIPSNTMVHKVRLLDFSEQPENTPQRLAPKIEVSTEHVADFICQDFANTKQVGGDHYKSLKIQPWEAMEAWLTPQEFIGFLKGNIIKYAARRKSSDDLEKLHHYSQKLQEFIAKHPELK